MYHNLRVVFRRGGKFAPRTAMRREMYTLKVLKSTSYRAHVYHTVPKGTNDAKGRSLRKVGELVFKNRDRSS